MEDTNLSAIYKETLCFFILLKHGHIQADIVERSRIQDKHNTVVAHLEHNGVKLTRYNFLTLKGL